MKYSKEKTKEICKYLEGLGGRIKACEMAHISYETFRRWMRKKDAFREAIKKAESKKDDKIRDIAILTIVKAMQEGQWTAAAWWLERKYNKEFALRYKQEHSGRLKLDGIMVLPERNED